MAKLRVIPGGQQSLLFPGNVLGDGTIYAGTLPNGESLAVRPIPGQRPYNNSLFFVPSAQSVMRRIDQNLPWKVPGFDRTLQHVHAMTPEKARRFITHTAMQTVLESMPYQSAQYAVSRVRFPFDPAQKEQADNNFGHDDWQLPTPEESLLLQENCRKGALAQVFDAGSFKHGSTFWLRQPITGLNEGRRMNMPNRAYAPARDFTKAVMAPRHKASQLRVCMVRRFQPGSP